MKSPHLLNLGNARKVKENLSGILDAASLASIEREIESNSEALLRLATYHFRFAERQTSPNWRQRVSRLYYAAYNGARAVRLYVAGDYSTDTKDHQRFGKLPEDFPSRSRYVNQLAVLREDRNTCDYDHACHAPDLVLGPRGSTDLVREFLTDVRVYLRTKGMNV